MIINGLEKIGHSTLQALYLTAGIIQGMKWPLFYRQLFRFGVDSIPIIVIAGIFTGSILTYQSYYALMNFGSTEMMGQLVAMSIHRELGPVMCALLLSGRAASSCTAELILMRATDQMNALQVLGANINRWVIYPRFLAYWLASILLSCIFNAIALLTSGILAVLRFSIDWNSYWSHMSQGVAINPDLTMWLYKSI